MYAFAVRGSTYSPPGRLLIPSGKIVPKMLAHLHLPVTAEGLLHIRAPRDWCRTAVNDEFDLQFFDEAAVESRLRRSEIRLKWPKPRGFWGLTWPPDAAKLWGSGGQHLLRHPDSASKCSAAGGLPVRGCGGIRHGWEFQQAETDALQKQSSEHAASAPGAQRNPMESKFLSRIAAFRGITACGLVVGLLGAPPAASAAKPAPVKADDGGKVRDAYVQAGTALLAGIDAGLTPLDEKLVAAGRALEASLRKDLAAAETRKHWATAAGLRLQLAALAAEPATGENRKEAALAVKRFLATVLVVGSEPTGLVAPRLDWKMQDVDLVVATLDDALLFVTERATLSVSALEPVGVSVTTSTNSGSRVVDKGYISNPELAAKRSELSAVDEELANVLRAIRATEAGATSSRGASGSSYTYKEYNSQVNSRSDSVNQGSTYKTTTGGSIYREARETRDHSADASLSDLARRRSDLEWRMQRLKSDIANLPATTHAVDTVYFKEEKQMWHGAVRRTWTLTMGKQVWTSASQVDLSGYTYMRDVTPGWQTQAEMMEIAKAEFAVRAPAELKALISKATLQRLETRAGATGDAKREGDWGRHFAFGPVPEMRELLTLPSVQQTRATRKANPPVATASRSTYGRPVWEPSAKALDWTTSTDPDLACPTGMAWVAGGSSSDDRVVGFCIDLTEMTAGDHAVAVAAGKASAKDMDCSPQSTFGKPDKLNHPINCVSYRQAADFCGNHGKRLPTAGEWEWVARGQALRSTFPWGNALPDNQLCWRRDVGEQGTCPVGTFPAGDSKQGIHDLAGGVSEWTSSSREPGATERIYRGGGWADSLPAQVESANRVNSGDPQSRWRSVGFRCAKTELPAN